VFESRKELTSLRVFVLRVKEGRGETSQSRSIVGFNQVLKLTLDHIFYEIILKVILLKRKFEGKAKGGELRNVSDDKGKGRLGY
jgi:hypothetical protein